MTLGRVVCRGAYISGSRAVNNGLVVGQFGSTVLPAP